MSNNTDTSLMFFNATSFDQPIGSWNVISLTNASNMLDNTPMSVINYDNLLVGWASLGSSLQPSVILGANGLQYTISTAGASRTYLTGTKLWSIVGDTGI